MVFAQIQGDAILEIDLVFRVIKKASFCIMQTRPFQLNNSLYLGALGHREILCGPRVPLWSSVALNYLSLNPSKNLVLKSPLLKRSSCMS
jgi:hypothetical protein